MPLWHCAGLLSLFLMMFGSPCAAGIFYCRVEHLDPADVPEDALARGCSVPATANGCGHECRHRSILGRVVGHFGNIRSYVDTCTKITQEYTIVSKLMGERGQSFKNTATPYFGKR